MDFEQISADWLRFMRGKRSQRSFSKRLGYRSNIAYRWETQVPSARLTPAAKHFATFMAEPYRASFCR
jgi:hypothetical protein